jgi:hypothetical protein
VKIEVTWNKPDGTKPVVGFQTQPNDPNADDDEMQMQKSVAGAQAHFQQKFGAAPPLNQLSVQTFSVNFTFLPLTDPRLQPEMTKTFIKVGQLVGWELPQHSQTYTGLLVVGEKTVPQGFQTMADCTLDIPATPVPMEKVGRIVQTVLREFQQRGQMNITTPAQA